MSKKKIIAIITIIVLLFAAGISVGVFLYGRGETEATDGSQTTDQGQVTDGNQSTGESQTGNNPITDVQNPDEEDTTAPGEAVDGAEDNETIENDNENANNQVANNNNATNNGITTDTNLDNVGETTISRVEEQERLISEDFLDWWQPMTVSVKPTEVGVELPQISIKKAAITGVGEDKFVYIGQDITYVIAVTNNGRMPVENIEITDRIPENTTYVADSIEDAVILKKVDGEITSEVVGTKSTVEVENKVVGVKWVVSIPAGETVIAKFTVNVNKTMLDANNAEVETTGTILNNAIANGEESNEVQTSIIRTHKSSIIKRNDEIVETAKIGDLITYTISIENTGDIEGTTYVMDEVPAGTQFVSAQEGSMVTKSVDTSIIWTVTVPAHTTITRKFTVEVISVDGLIKNVATVGGTPTNEDIIDTANIDVVKTATAVKRAGENEFTTPVGNVKENDIIQYTIVVTNTGSRDLTNVLLEEQLDRVEVTKLVVDGIEKDIVKDKETGKLIIGDLKAAKEATEETEAVEAGVAVITATYTVSYSSEMNNGNEGYKDGTLEFIYNKVRATGETIPKTPEEVPEEVEDDDDEIVPVIPDPNFIVEKTAIQVKRVGESEFEDLIGKVRPGDIVKYEIVITNTGNTKLTNIEVRDTLDVIVDEYVQNKEPITAGNIIKVIPSLVSGAKTTITTYYEVNENDITLGKVNEEDLIEIEVIKNIVTAKPEELEEKEDDEIVPVNPNTKVEGTKTWADNNNQDGKRPESITIRLLADGKEVQNKKVKASDNWSWLFDKLPVYDGENQITYTITEDAVAEYTTSVDGYNVTNTHIPEITAVKGTKTWVDNNDQDGKRPESITIRLLADGKEVQNKEVKSSDNWSWSFENLPVYEKGKKLVYTITEDTVAEYTTNIDGYNVTNTHIPEITAVNGTKTWADNNDQDGKRPESITIRLLVDGKEVQNKEVKASDNWSWAFENLPVYEKGKKLVYTITEDTVAEYTTNVDGYNVTNTHIPETTAVKGTKTWVDNNNQDGKRPECITIRLLADGKEVQNKEVKSSDNWSWSFENLPVYENGKKLVYTITEDAVAEYTTNVDGYNVTNTHIPETTAVNGTKTWLDNNNQDGKRPESIIIRLLADKNQVTFKKITANDNWSWSFENLPVYENGKKLEYTVTEDDVSYYTTTVDGYNVINTHIPETIDLTGTKTWKDNDNQDGKRPESITIRLLVDGKEVQNKEVKASDNWSWSFENLPVYENGKKLEYTITEDAVAEYTTTVDGFNVTNKHVPETTTINGTKTWVDNNNKDGKRPTSIIIRLLADGKEVQNKEVKASDNWSWSFENLPVYKSGTKIQYTIKEDQVSGYSTPEVNEYNVINTILQQYCVDISGTKTWRIPDEMDKTNLPDVTIMLYKNGEPVKDNAGNNLVATIEDGGDYYEFKGLPKYKVDEKGNYILKANGEFEENEYKVIEVPVEGYVSSPANGYTTSKDSNKNEYNFINTIKQEISIRGTKYWVDNNNQDGKRPQTITIKLFADGKELDVIPSILKDKYNEWTYTFSGLNRYTDLGKEINYTVTEEAVPEYITDSIIQRQAENGNIIADITNRHTPETITVKTTKTWDDNNNKHEDRPSSIEIQLYKTVKGSKTSMGDDYKVTLTPAGENGAWLNTESKEWQDLPKYEGGNKITYSVEEKAITNYKATYTNTTDTNGNVTANIKNTWRQDITGTITTIEETEVPLDVVFVLDISSSMLDKDGGNKTRAQYMVEAANSSIKELMKSPNNRISVVLFNSDVYQLTDANTIKHYNSNANGNYITYQTVNETYVGGRISFVNGKTVDVSKSTYPTGSYKCGTYTQGGIKTATQIFSNAGDSTGTRKPVMILLTDGDPTHYDTKTSYNEYGTKYPTVGEGIAKLRYITPEYYAYTMKTMQKCKSAITGFYGNKACELYTVGINMKGTMAKALLEPTKANIDYLSETTNSEVSPEIHNHDDDGKQHPTFSHVDADGVWRKNAAYYKYQAGELEGLLKNNNTTKVTPGYVNKAYTNSTSGDIANNFADIVRKITEVKTVITDELYGNDRRIELNGFNPTSEYNQQSNAKNVYSLKIKSDKVNVDTKNINDSNSTKYIKKDPTTNKYYLVLTDVLGCVEVELTYHK